MPIIIDLIRHGEPLGGKKYRGHMDDPLSDLGFRQMRDAIGVTYPWNHIVSSPLKRCSQFAMALSSESGIPISIDERLKEICFGVWEGQTPQQVCSFTPDATRNFYKDPLNFPPPLGENFQLFAERVMAAWSDLVRRWMDEHVLVVAHGVVIRVVLAHMLDMSLKDLFQLEVDYAALSRIQVFSGSSRKSVVSYNGMTALT